MQCESDIRTASVKVAHCFSSFRNLGGVEQILRHHYASDALASLASDFIIYFETDGVPDPRLHFLGFNGRTTLRSCRLRFAQAIDRISPDLTVYHGLWGMPDLVDLDRGQRRIVLLHGSPEGFADALIRRQGWLDGILCVSKPLAESVHTILPNWPKERLSVLPSPISPPARLPAHTPLGDGPLKLGYCGRLIREAKRVDRLLPLCRALQNAGVDFHLEILGDGPEQRALQEQFPDRQRFIFHGRKEGSAYWETIARWHAIVFVSDSEGLPLSLLEALSCGVVPVYPRIGSGGDEYVEKVWPPALYEPEGFGELALRLKKLSRMSEGEWEGLRTRCQALAAEHAGDKYVTRFAEFVRRMLSEPGRTRTAVARRPFPIEFCSLNMMAKLGRVRSGLARLNPH